MVIPLSQLNPGDSGRVIWLASSYLLKQRLLDLGFEPDEVLTCELQSSPHGMRAYRVRDSLIALRKENAAEIFVETL
ncbi:MAG: FeoA family protein [Lachnospiraceae bacterium]